MTRKLAVSMVTAGAVAVGVVAGMEEAGATVAGATEAVGVAVGATEAGGADRLALRCCNNPNTRRHSSAKRGLLAAWISERCTCAIDSSTSAGGVFAWFSRSTAQLRLQYAQRCSTSSLIADGACANAWA
jgi:hypothetical protein